MAFPFQNEAVLTTRSLLSVEQRFHGTVTAREALQQSYNLPAVTLLDWLGAGRVAATLRGAGAPRAPALRQLPPRDGRLFGTNAPRILFPPPDSVMELHPGQTIALEAAGGVPPYQWAVNGIPLAPPPLGSLPEWHPDGAGFAHLTLTDAADHSTQETLRLQ